MIVLAVDTCLPACTAVLAENGRVLAAKSEPMLKGHQERLAPMVAELMAEAGLEFGALDRAAATVGPGSFTGLRVGLSFARAMAAALGVPCAGIGTLEALASGKPGFVMALMDARRGQAYWQTFEDGAPLTAPAITAVADIASAFRGRASPLVVGPGAHLAETILPGAEIEILGAATPDALATLACRAEPPPPGPVYLRAPDAKLPGGKAPPP